MSRVESSEQDIPWNFGERRPDSSAQGDLSDSCNHSYVVDVHVPVKPAGVKLNDKALAGLDKKEEFDKAAEGWFFDARDRRGVLHVKTKSLPLASGFTVRIGL